MSAHDTRDLFDGLRRWDRSVQESKRFSVMGTDPYLDAGSHFIGDNSGDFETRYLANSDSVFVHYFETCLLEHLN